MSEFPYFIEPKMVTKLPLQDIPDRPNFKWLPDDPKIFPLLSNATASVGLQLAAYCLPWTLKNLNERQFYVYRNPKWGLLDLLGGRSNRLFEWPKEGFETVIREAVEEASLRIELLATSFDRCPLFWLLNTEKGGNTFGPVFKPLLIKTGDLVALPLSPLVSLNEQTATRRLLATLAVIQLNPQLLQQKPSTTNTSLQ